MAKEEQAASNTGPKKKIFRNDQYFGFAAYARAKSGNWKLFINWKRIIFLLAFFAVLGYLGIAYARTTKETENFRKKPIVFFSFFG